jgi:gamma-butyrobetaine dioxygenase
MPTTAPTQTPHSTANAPLQRVEATSEEALRVVFQGHAPMDYNLFWLRDHCPSGFHAQTHERTFDLLSLPDTLTVAHAAIDAQGNLVVHWASDGHISHFSADWLWQRRPGHPRHDPAQIAPTPWRTADWPQGPKRFLAADILQTDSALQAWLVHTKQYGFSLVHGVGNDAQTGMQIAKRIGFLRETNFGVSFEVRNKPDPNNLAYTAIELPLHTDLPNQELPPGFQFLHCLRNEAQGGGSVLADGFALAQQLQHNDPQAFETLCTVQVPFRFFDPTADIRISRPIITRDTQGAVTEIAYSAHIADLIGLRNEELGPWYRAYRSLMRLTRDDSYRLNLKMDTGDMLVFDNRRVLHGREAFDPNSGQRHLHGCYVDRVEFDSRLRLLG